MLSSSSFVFASSVVDDTYSGKCTEYTVWIETLVYDTVVYNAMFTLTETDSCTDGIGFNDNAPKWSRWT